MKNRNGYCILGMNCPSFFCLDVCFYHNSIYKFEAWIFLKLKRLNIYCLMESLTFINGRMAPGRTYIKGFIMASTTIAKSLCGEIDLT